MRGSIRVIRGVLLFGYFLLDKQEKVALGAGREHPAFIYTPPVGRPNLQGVESGAASFLTGSMSSRVMPSARVTGVAMKIEE